MKNYRLLLLFLLLFFLVSCNNKPDSKETAGIYLDEKGFVEDHTIDSELNEVIKGINSIAEPNLGKILVTADNYNRDNANQILVVPFRKKSGTGTISGFSDIENNLIFICPVQIKEFVLSNSLNDSNDVSGYLGIILLHELGHFSMGISGAFDEGVEQPTHKSSNLGEVDMGTEPELMTTQKREELKVDSVAVEFIKKGVKTTQGNCFTICFNVQLAVNGAEFMLFGKRIINSFGSSNPQMIHDKSWTHPNLELRLAFMNYYLNPTTDKKTQIDNYLYEREIDPIHKQEIDPRIYQGNEK